MHPYYCTWDKYCEHCTNAVTEWHDANKCWRCCDGDPRYKKPSRLVDEPFAIRISVWDISHRRRRVKVRIDRQVRLAI